MVRAGQHGGGGTDLGNLPLVQDGQPVRQVAHHGQVVGDEQVGDAAGVPRGRQQLQHNGLNAHVQR